MRITAKVAILLLLGLASKEDYTLAHQLQQTSVLDMNQQLGSRLLAGKVARPTSISFDQLSMKEDTLGTDLADAAKLEEKQKQQEKKSAPAPAEAAPEAAPTIKVQEAPQNNKQQTSSDDDDSKDDGNDAADSTNKLNQVSSDQKSGSQAEEQVDQTEESKLADQIRNQAKAIADEQSKQQQKDQAAGKLKISSAAAALNNAEMGIEVAAEESEANKNEIVNISSDQLYVGDKSAGGNGKKDVDEPVAAPTPNGEPSTEAAAITMAKQAAKNVVEGKTQKSGATDAKADPKKNANVEIEQSSDLESTQKIADLEKNSSEMADAGLSRQNSLVEDKSQVIEDESANSEKKEKEDLAVPNWPKYQDPVGQRAEIDKELKQVKQQTEEFKKNSEEAEAQIKSGASSKSSGTEFEQKQKELDVQHKATVNKIKSEIWGDRLSFLQKMVKLSDETKQDMQGQDAPEKSSQPVQNTQPTPKAQALAQESTKGKTQEEDTQIKKKSNLAQKESKKDSIKKNLIHRIDKQLNKLKKQSLSSTKGKEVGDDDEDDTTPDVETTSAEPATTSTDEDTTTGEADTATDGQVDSYLDKIDNTIRSSNDGHYLDAYADEYSTNKNNIYNRVDSYRGRKDLDLYDIFKDFDRDGDGIVDDIDLDDPSWTSNCKKNGYFPLEDYDDSTFKAGRYRGLTEEQWTQRESQHQRNLDLLEKKQTDLENAHKEVHEALTSLTTEKDSIDKEIKQKVMETEKMKVEFRKKAAERAAEERKAAMEREKALMVERQEERKRKAQQIQETEQIEGKAIQLHGKAKELQKQKLLVKDARVEVAEEIRKLKANIKYAQRAKQAAIKIKERIAQRRELMKKQREDQMELRKKNQELRLKEQQAEMERRQRLQDSCPRSKVRSYACNADNLRLVKIFSYVYDFDYNKCVPRVQRKTVSCRGNQYDLEGDGIDDYSTGYRTTNRQYDDDLNDYADADYGYSRGASNYDGYGDQDLGSYGYRRYHADEFAQRKSQAAHQKGAQSGVQKGAQKNAQKEKGSDQGETLTAEEEQELKDMQDAPESKPHLKKKQGKPAPRKAAQASEDQTSADSLDFYDTTPTNKESKQNVVQRGTKKQMKKKKAAESNIESQSKEQIEQLNKHLGAIEGKVSEITQKYEELKKADESKDKKIKKLSEARVQMSNKKDSKDKATEEKNDLKKVDKSKIQKFAKMLKQLNQYKSKYKKAKTQQEKKKIHQQVVSFTQKWLDAKNLLIQSKLEFRPPSEDPIVDPTFEAQRNELNHDVVVRSR